MAEKDTEGKVPAEKRRGFEKLADDLGMNEDVLKGVTYPGHLSDKAGVLDRSPNPAKAMGQNMLIGAGSFLASMFMGNGLLPSLLFGIGGGVLGQECKSMALNLVDLYKGDASLKDRRTLTTVIPMVVAALVGTMMPSAGMGLMTTLIGGALGSKVSNTVMGSDDAVRYYDGVPALNTDFKDREEEIRRSKAEEELKQGIAARPEIGENREKEQATVESRENRTAVGKDTVTAGRTVSPEETVRQPGNQMKL